MIIILNQKKKNKNFLKKVLIYHFFLQLIVQKKLKLVFSKKCLMIINFLIQI